ncbi:NAD/NADP transhydrogenase alpha subunit-like protein [Azospirillum sp. RWY-5-1]|uniref:NAD/NADP transhydrogenase alpha subunit-like protein n=2 Tax=Azospirillum oleiclasticum TaxID=2735135 RepID=A0ABX2TN92_9PROT|nr:NAD/NADP transhydrogenase alpha subunit-like protein [Azospirillum oleiclasticum]NYZ25115.1 NAD/NADP transhydrogenase alpha subunit-like protein [Azospirillum oleiclasticum]
MGTPSDVLDPSTMRYAVTLNAGVPKTIAVPAGAQTVLFASTGPFWVRYGAPAALPVDDDTGGDAPELAPAARWIARVTVLGLVAPAACTVSLAFYG